MTLSPLGIDALVLTVAWLAYFVMHSLLASLQMKRWIAAHWPDLMPAYRLLFNVIALLLLVPIFWLMAAQAWPLVWQWHGLNKLIANTAAVFAVLGFVWSLKYYDMQEFLGLRQWRAQIKAVEDQARLQISPLHRFVRHPWYFFLLLLLWSRDMNVAQFVTSVLLSVYLVIGSRLEEQKLLEYYGERYRRYRQRVPGLFPLPWKFMRAAEAESLTRGTFK